MVLPNGKLGFYNDDQVYNGQVINIKPKHFSERWMKKITPKRRAKKSGLQIK